MQQRAVMEQVGRGIAGQVKLGQHECANAALSSLANSRQCHLGIALNIDHANPRRSRRHTQKAIVLISRNAALLC